MKTQSRQPCGARRWPDGGRRSRDVIVSRASTMQQRLRKRYYNNDHSRPLVPVPGNYNHHYGDVIIGCHTTKCGILTIISIHLCVLRVTLKFINYCIIDYYGCNCITNQRSTRNHIYDKRDLINLNVIISRKFTLSQSTYILQYLSSSNN